MCISWSEAQYLTFTQNSGLRLTDLQHSTAAFDDDFNLIQVFVEIESSPQIGKKV